MKIVSIEPTPSPNTMKLNMDERVERGRTYDHTNQAHAPIYIRKMLEVAGVKSIFQTADFIAVDRLPNADWRTVLAHIRMVFGEINEQQLTQKIDEHYGEARLYIQYFRGIPMQIRVKTDWEEARESLSARFVNAAMEAGLSSPNLIKERRLEDKGVRYGELQDIAKEVLAELESEYSDERLQASVERAKRMESGDELLEEWRELSDEEIAQAMSDQDWRVRYRAFSQLKPTEAHLDLLRTTLQDDNVSVRRLAVVYLGDIGEESVLPLLYIALQDQSAVIRRTAGDTLSDIGNPLAIEAMLPALQDRNKLVRWRAARFLYEVGDERALDALRQASEDPEFEVALQAQLALERIEQGKEAEGTIWQQMTRLREEQ